jgi:hypothetical protein
MVRLPLALLVGLALALSACSEAKCESLESCDIRDRSCQDHVAKVVACLRDSRAVTPRTDVIDADEFIEDQVRDANEEPLDDDTRAHFRSLHLFGLMPYPAEAGDLARAEWENVAAFFDSDTGRVTVLDRGQKADGPSAVIVLAHELVHAQQSRETGEKFYPPVDDSRDAHWAATALVEGEATLYQDLAETYAYGWEPADVDWDSTYRDFERASFFYALQDDSLYQRGDSWFAYAFGGTYVSRPYVAGGSRAVRKATRAVPESTRNVIAGYDRDPVSFPVESLEDVAIPILPDSFSYLSSERAGAFLFGSFTALVEPELAGLSDLRALGVTGDSLSTFRVAPDAAAAFWRVRFETADQAIALQQQFDPRLTIAITREDRDLIFAAVSDRDLRESIAAGLSWGPAPEPEVEPTGDEEPKRSHPLRCRIRALPRP